jgi:DNA-binding transcriptional ArsR family regulator
MQGLAHPIRLAIVDLLRDGEVCVCDIATGSARSAPTFRATSP